MASFLLAHEPAIRLGVFAGLLAVMAGWETLTPRRRRSVPRRARWPGNLGVVVIDAALVRVLFPVAAAGLGALGEARGWGLLNNLDLPGWAAAGLAFILLDLAIYLQHVTFHAVPALWRLHRMHHADLDFDVTTGVRFHPIEILLSMGWKLAVVAAAGAPAVAVLLFEVMLNATAMFSHGNVALPEALDRILRSIVVTPDMHRVHHSIVPSETNSNFGFNLPWWDRLLGTYRAQPAGGHDGMTIGLDVFRDPAQLRLDRMLVQPFIGPVGAYPNIGRLQVRIVLENRFDRFTLRQEAQDQLDRDAHAANDRLAAKDGRVGGDPLEKAVVHLFCSLAPDAPPYRARRATWHEEPLFVARCRIWGGKRIGEAELQQRFRV